MTWLAAWGLREDDEEPFYTYEGTFDEAKEWLMNELRHFLTDECNACREQGTKAFVDLDAAFAAWQGVADGHDYWLTESTK